MGLNVQKGSLSPGSKYFVTTGKKEPYCSKWSILNRVLKSILQSTLQTQVELTVWNNEKDAVAVVKKVFVAEIT